MDHTEGAIAVPDGVHDDPHGKQVIDLVDCLALVHHLFVDGKQVLRAPIDLRVNSGLADMHFDIAHDLIDEGLSLALLQRYLFHEVIVDLRLEVLERQVVQFHLDLADTKTLRDRRVDFPRLPRLLLLLLRTHVLERAHIVQPVCQFDQDDTDILRHGKEHLPKILGLRVQLVGGIVQPSQLCDAIHQKRDLRPELLQNLLLRHDRILHDVMKKTRYDRLLVQFKIGQDDRHAEGMNDIRLSGLSFLVLVGFICNPVGFIDHGKIIGRMILPDSRYQLPVQFLRAGEILHHLRGRIRLDDLQALCIRKLPAIRTRSRNRFFAIWMYPSRKGCIQLFCHTDRLLFRTRPGFSGRLRLLSSPSACNTSVKNIRSTYVDLITWFSSLITFLRRRQPSLRRIPRAALFRSVPQAPSGIRTLSLCRRASRSA